MWRIETTDGFDAWYSALDKKERECVLASLLVLGVKGPQLPRPWADTIKGSRYPNMKELRIQCRGKPIRAFYAFDVQRTGIILCAGDKSVCEKRFYDVMLPIAEQEYADHLKRINKKE
ncbi:type II toxin-antitoxin system RelE/ParE family toxin [Enterobacter sp.]|uniref:type II toxin-antitoxin system RelE/ParE family toxin n=1 Tax=Enterobacter sp. TaxID=42895 RepID=UPI00296F9742|nr:type II toxin-antitoxin system RelE/ParE family toxin [Enterobacter sp.]